MNNRIPCTFAIENMSLDSNLIPVRLRLLHENVNRNKSSIEFSVMDNAKDSLKNKPILAYIKRTEDGEVDFDEHNIDMELKQNDNGEYYIKKIYKEFPVGIIPESTEIFYESIDGKMYMGCTGYIHRDYSNETIDLLKETDGKCVSIEIEVKDGVSNVDTGVYEIKDFVFKGVTILSDSVKPGMDENCRIDFFKNEEYSTIMDKIYNEIYSLSEQQKEGENMLENKENVENLEIVEDEKTYALSITNIIDQIIPKLEELTVDKEDYWGDTYKTNMFYYVDILPTLNILVVRSSLDGLYFGIPYVISEDSVNLDFENKKEYISEWREKNTSDEVFYNTYIEDYNVKTRIMSKFKSKDEEINNIKAELEDLKAFKQSILDAEYEKEIEDIINEFTLNTENLKIQLSKEEIVEFKEKVLNKQITKEDFKGELYKLQGIKFMANKELLLNSKNETFSHKEGISLKLNKDVKPTLKPYGGILG